MNIKEIEQRVSAATAGPWHVVHTDEHGVKGFGNILFCPDDDCIVDAGNNKVLGCSEWTRMDEEALQFMAHARQDIEDLLAEVKRLKVIRRWAVFDPDPVVVKAVTND